MSEHVVSPRIYLGVWITLMALTLTTTLLAFVDLGPFSPVVALVIAVTKATLVVLFFMHVRYSPKLTAIVVIGACLWLAILLTMTMSDYITRNWSLYK